MNYLLVVSINYIFLLFVLTILISDFRAFSHSPIDLVLKKLQTYLSMVARFIRIGAIWAD